jgi:hypothetical protein
MDKLQLHFHRNKREQRVKFDMIVKSIYLLCLLSEWIKKYSLFAILLPQQNTTRTAFLRANISFDYDAPGKTIVSIEYLLNVVLL